MKHVRPLLAVVAAALTLAACVGTGTITDPAFRNDRAAPAAHTRGGFHADNTGAGGSGYDVQCANGGTFGSGYNTGTGCTSASVAPSTGIGTKPGTRPTPFHRPDAGTQLSRPRPSADCIPDLLNTGAGGSGYNYCPPA